VLEEAKKESREKIASLVKENAKRMEALVNQFKSKKEVLAKLSTAKTMQSRSFRT